MCVFVIDRGCKPVYDKEMRDEIGERDTCATNRRVYSLRELPPVSVPAECLRLIRPWVCGMAA